MVYDLIIFQIVLGLIFLKLREKIMLFLYSNSLVCTINKICKIIPMIIYR